jgi:hypothetical protein
MANSPNDSAAFDFYAGTHPVSGVPLALIELAATASTSASTLTSQDEVDIDVAGGEVPTGAHLALGLLNTTTIDPSFESLEFLLTDSGATIVNKTFNSLASAQAYFDDQLIDLGPILSASSIHVEFDITTDGQGQGLNSEFVLGSLPVPEPTAGALGSMAMLALLPRRRRRAPRD